MKQELQQLASLLRERLRIIGDHELRDRDPEAHLEQLKSVSEAIASKHAELAPHLDVRTNHFFQQASYDKALAWIEQKLDSTAR